MPKTLTLSYEDSDLYKGVDSLPIKNLIEEAIKSLKELLNWIRLKTSTMDKINEKVKQLYIINKRVYLP